MNTDLENVFCILGSGRQCVVLIKRIKLFTVVSLSLAFLFVYVYSGNCFAQEKPDKEKNKECVSLRPQEIKYIIKTKLNAPGANLLNINESPIKGLCEIVFDNNGRVGVFYLTVDKNYLISGPVWKTVDMFNLTLESIKAVKDNKRIDVAKIPLKDAIIMGESSASKKVIIFTDPDCPYCGQLHQTMKQIVAKRKDIAFYIKFFPLSIHKDAYWKAKSIVCNRSLKMLEDNFEKKEIPKTECTTEEIDNSIKLAGSLDITGTPAIILPDGRFRDGAMPEVELTDVIDGKK
jgi:thiol:disulfide interchange protein DsbC